MSDEAHENEDHEERTEEATPQRREQARERGQMARSRDLVSALTMLAGVAALALCAPGLARALLRLGHDAFGNLDLDLHQGPLATLWPGLRGLGLGILPLFLGTTAVAVIATLVQTGVPHSDLLVPDLSRFQPLARLQQLFTPGLGGWELLKTVLKIGAVALGAWQILHPLWIELGHGGHFSPAALGARMWQLSGSLLLRLGLLWLGLAALDYLLAHSRIERQLRMSRREVREELRYSEGNPQIKRRLRRKARELLRRRLAVDVPRADVVVVNPTHVAVALQYKVHKMRAPKVVAKGLDHMALRIRELARGAGVPVISNPPLARVLHKRVKVGGEVPGELYRAVAEVLAFVYRIRNRAPALPAGRETRTP